ncbi:precorrin-3B methylase [Lysinibacillus sp. LZ02]|uniref:precorrin-3B methylase n=1 Tax=Lysinibacillus sp. LZ02 TaxID=3420668 RepID=UPI003D36C4DA
MGRNAFTKNVPEHTFATLNKESSYTRLAISPGVINKHYTPAQLQKIAEIVGEDGAIKYSASYYLLISIPTEKRLEIQQQLEDAGLYIAKHGAVVDMKACDFCDGEKMEAAAIMEALYKTFIGQAVPNRLRMNVNGCASACYNAMYDDIGLVYQQESFDVYVGAIPMGRHAQAGKLFAKNISVENIEAFLQAMLHIYNEFARENEPFHRFFKRTKVEAFWANLLVSHID